MRTRHSQRGLSLMAMVVVGVLLILALVYAKAFVQIPYTTYKVKSIINGILDEGTTSPKEIEKVFNSRTMFEGINSTVNADNLTIDITDRTATVNAEYDHCEPLWTTWTVCSAVDLTVTRPIK